MIQINNFQTERRLDGLNNQILVNNIKKICKSKNISISVLERDLFMSSGLISRWAKTTPALDRVLEIANYLQVSLDTLIGNANETTNNDKTINHLLLKLYNKTINAEIEWQIFNPNNTAENLHSQIISSIITENNMDCFYCIINNGSFILTVVYNDGSKDLSLYVLADENSLPEQKCSDNEKLYNLYNYLLKRLSKQLNIMKTNNFINGFLSQDDSDASLPNNVTILTLNNAVNE